MPGLLALAEDPRTTLGVQDLTSGLNMLNPTLSYITPAQTVCGYGTLLLRNGSDLASDGDKVGNAAGFGAIAAPYNDEDPFGMPNTQGLPSDAPSNGPGPTNFLNANNYPNTAAPGQSPKECAAGREGYSTKKQVIGNPSGNLGLTTQPYTGTTTR